MLTQQLPATIDDYAAAIDYLVQLAGVDHTAIGPDFMEEMPLEVVQKVLGGLPPEVIQMMQAMPPVQNFDTAAKMGNITAVLLQRGYKAKDVQKIMGSNWLQLYEQVW